MQWVQQSMMRAMGTVVGDHSIVRVAINLLTDDPATPSGAHWGWTRIIPEVAALMRDDEELHLVVSPRMKPLHEGYGDRVRYVMAPWSNERATCGRSEHVSFRCGCRAAGIDVFNTLIAPSSSRRPAWSRTSRRCTRSPSRSRFARSLVPTDASATPTPPRSPTRSS